MVYAPKESTTNLLYHDEMQPIRKTKRVEENYGNIWLKSKWVEYADRIELKDAKLNSCRAEVCVC